MSVSILVRSPPPLRRTILKLVWVDIWEPCIPVYQQVQFQLQIVHIMGLLPDQVED